MKVSTTLSVDISVLIAAKNTSKNEELSMNRFTEVAWEALVHRLETGKWPQDVEKLLTASKYKKNGEQTEVKK